MIELPQSYGHEILRAEVGSTLHGTGLGVALEDHDEMGVFVEWPRSTIGLGQREHWGKRTAKEGERSQPGDTDLICYSLRKFAHLALSGNPSVLLPLFAPEDKLVITSELGDELRRRAPWFASRQAGKAFLGYMTKQRQRMTGERGRAGRVRKSPDGKVDWKYAMHMLRLGYQGVEFLQTGSLELPVPEPVRGHLQMVRQGFHPLEDVLHEAEVLEDKVKLLLDMSPLPQFPDKEAVEGFVMSAHLSVWNDHKIKGEI